MVARGTFHSEQPGVLGAASREPSSGGLPAPNKALAHEPPKPPAFLKTSVWHLNRQGFHQSLGGETRAVPCVTWRWGGGRRARSSGCSRPAPPRGTAGRPCRGTGRPRRWRPPRGPGHRDESRQLLRKQEPAEGSALKAGALPSEPTGHCVHSPLSPRNGGHKPSDPDGLLQSAGSLGRSQGSRDARILNVRGHTHVLSSPEAE